MRKDVRLAIDINHRSPFDIIRRNEKQMWFLSQHLVEGSLVEMWF